MFSCITFILYIICIVLNDLLGKVWPQCCCPKVAEGNSLQGLSQVKSWAGFSHNRISGHLEEKRWLCTVNVGLARVTPAPPPSLVWNDLVCGQAESSGCHLPGLWQGVPQPFSQHSELQVGQWALRGHGQAWHPGQVRAVVPCVWPGTRPQPQSKQCGAVPGCTHTELAQEPKLRDSCAQGRALF